MVYPGTTAYEEAKKADYIQIEDWGAWLTEGRSIQQRRHAVPNITTSNSVSFCDQARRSFYSSPFLSFLTKLIAS